jgi:glutamate-1-semialdehyde 2,1-aminomutase
MQPFPIYVDRAQGSRKWDVDGNEYIDYVMGHGALFMGHAHPKITAAVVEQAQKGTHYGANHRLELEWGALVRQIVPSAEEVRFTSSGTEATLMAIRLAPYVPRPDPEVRHTSTGGTTVVGHADRRRRTRTRRGPGERR